MSVCVGQLTEIISKVHFSQVVCERGSENAVCVALVIHIFCVLVCDESAKCYTA